ncbi:hypothetical protein [Streptomyces tendae]
MDLDPDLSALRPLGGFFVLHASRPVPAGRTAEAAPLAHAYAPGYGNAAADVQVPVRRADPLGRRVRKVAAALGAPETRVAASVAQQGLAARLWSVTLACAARYGHVPDLDPRLLHWDPEATAPDDLWLTEVRALPADTDTVAPLSKASRRIVFRMRNMLTWFPRPTPSASNASRKRSTTSGVTVFSFREPRRGKMCTLRELPTCSPVEYSVIFRCRDRHSLAYSATVFCPSSRRASATDGAVRFFSV